MTCWADYPRLNLDEPFYVLNFPKSLSRFLERHREPKESGVDNRSDVLEADIESGKIVLPSIEIKYTLALCCHDPDASLVTPGHYGFVHCVL